MKASCFFTARDIDKGLWYSLREWDGTIVSTSAADDERSDRRQAVNFGLRLVIDSDVTVRRRLFAPDLTIAVCEKTKIL